MRRVLYIQFDTLFFNIFPKNTKEKWTKMDWTEMKWNDTGTIACRFYGLRCWIYLSANIIAYFVQLYDRWLMFERKNSVNSFLFSLYLVIFSDKRLIYRHKCRKHFTQFVQFLFFYLTFFNVWLKRHLKTYISSFIGSHIVLLITFLYRAANRIMSKYRIKTNV